MFGGEPNTNVCPVCLGLPGALPVVNGKAVESAIRIGLALNCEIAEWCRFARKNYFYPDMPKNFQTSQYDEPIAFDGFMDVEVDGETYRIEIERAHMEEDTGKSSHMGGATGRIHGADYSLLDYNRAGIPLIEIVTKTIEVPGDKAPLVARAYVQQLRDLVLALGVSDARMDQGSLRCDVNLSLQAHRVVDPRHPQRDQERQLLPLGRAGRPLRGSRHAGILDAGGSVVQETRHFHEDTGSTSPGREKSDAEDYRYFPEPDLAPVAPSREWVEELRATLPEPPVERRAGCRPSGASPTSRCVTPPAPGRWTWWPPRSMPGPPQPRPASGGSPSSRAGPTRPRSSWPSWHHSRRRRADPGAGRRRLAQRQARASGLRRRAGR